MGSPRAGGTLMCVHDFTVAGPLTWAPPLDPLHWEGHTPSSPCSFLRQLPACLGQLPTCWTLRALAHSLTTLF